MSDCRRITAAFLGLMVSASMLAACSTDNDIADGSANETTATEALDDSLVPSNNSRAAVYLEESAVSDSIEPFSSYTFDFSDGESNYMITVELNSDGKSFNITTENSSFEYSSIELSAPENYTLNIPFSQDSASSVCNIIKNTVDDEPVPDILEFKFYLNNFEDEGLPYVVSAFMAINSGELGGITIVDDTGDSPKESEVCGEIDMLHTESNVFMPVPQVEIDENGVLSAEVYTYTFDPDAMTMTKRIQPSEYEESPLYYGYKAHAAADYIAKYFTMTSLNVSDYENYVEIPSVNSDMSDYFFKVDDPRFSTVDELKDFTRKFFTEKIVNELFINAPQKYRDIDGELYTIVGDGGVDFTLGDLTITGIEESGNTVTYHTKQEKFDENGKLQSFIDGGDFTVERADDGSFTVTQYRIVY
ncbi:MAG: hypothetical protein LUI05_00805 [Oscillospiraceae bacterium]|nr:hypothetical protein [Oscillospiraceae bacterium]